MEGLLYTNLDRYPDWPQQSATNDTLVVLCHRSDADTLVVSGLTWIDYGYRRFPSRLELRRTESGSVVVTGFIGQVDPRTGAPPRFPENTYMVPGTTGPELLLGHRSVPITWTRAFTLPP